MLEAIKLRINWLEGLKTNAEERARLSEITGIELTLEVIDTIIEAAKQEALFIESQIRLLLEGTEAQAAPIFTAEARDYSQILDITYGPEYLNLGTASPTLEQRWY